MYKEGTCWGLSTSIDVKGCNKDLIRDESAIIRFAKELVDLIKMVAYGEPQVIHFGSGNKAGFTLVQLIETSNITGHFAEESNAAYIDIFSCKPYDPMVAGEFTKNFFDGSEVMIQFNFRR